LQYLQGSAGFNIQNMLSIFARCGKEPDHGQYLEQYLLPEQSKIAQKCSKIAQNRSKSLDLEAPAPQHRVNIQYIAIFAGT